MTIVHLGLGGNLGDPLHAMAEALRALDAHAETRVLAVSPVYRTPPWGPVEQPPFLNACATIETALGASELLALCLSVEAKLHRDRSVRWGPRTVDIDLLDFGGERVRTENLTLPHPRMGERAFVLVPLADIAPDLTIDGLPIGERLKRLDRSGIERVETVSNWWRSG